MDLNIYIFFSLMASLVLKVQVKNIYLRVMDKQFLFSILTFCKYFYQVENELPEKIERLIRCEASSYQKLLMKRVEENLGAIGTSKVIYFSTIILRYIVASFMLCVQRCVCYILLHGDLLYGFLTINGIEVCLV